MSVELAGIGLPEDIQWVDEFTDFGVGQVITPTLTGALLIEEVQQPHGRPISLQTGVNVWVSRSVVEALYALQSTPLQEGESLVLQWGDGRQFDVVFDHSRGAFSASEIRRLAASAQGSEHKYSVSIALLVKE